MSCGHACHKTLNSTYQTLEEINFDQGIWSCAVHGNEERLKLLLSRGSDVNRKDNFGYTALHYAARNGHLGVAKLLIQNGADVFSRTNSMNSTCLHRAAYAGHLELIKMIISNEKPSRKEALVSALDVDGETCLHSAAKGGMQDVYDWLAVEYPHLLLVRSKSMKLAPDVLQSHLS